ncbi:MAG: trypsin-like serine protease [Myxococcota bacterium]
MRVSLLSLLLSFSLACAADVSFEATQSPIVDGTPESGFEEVMFLFNNAQGSACTATLIAPLVALTAKHCVQDGNRARAAAARNFFLFVGPSANRPRRQYNIREVRPAPGRWDIRDASDVALLILSAPAFETPRAVSFENPTRLARTQFTAIGYGQTPAGRSGTKFRTEKVVDGVSQGVIFVRPSVCQGDSGGPLIGYDGAIWGVASFIFSEDGRQPRCGTAPGAYNSIQAYQEMIETAIEETGGCFPTEEVCNNIDDDCNGEVDEGCTALGEVCITNEECSSELCQTTTGGTICTQECDPLRPRIGCPAGFLCESTANSCSGLCAPDNELSLELGAACSRNADCASGVCADSVCAAPCAPGRGLCLADEVCAAPDSGCGACVAADTRPGPRNLGESCDTNEDCREGNCFEASGVAYCSRTCEDDAGCGEGFYCRTNTCILGQREGTGGACVDNDDCAGGFCVTEGERTWCSDFCTTGEECPDGFACSAVGDAMICQPELALVGEACETNDECTDALCVTAAGGSRCSRFCSDQNPCSPGFECVRVGANGVCLQPFSETGPETSGTPDAGTGGGDGGGGSGGCSTAPLSSAPWLPLGLLFVARRRKQ